MLSLESFARFSRLQVSPLKLKKQIQHLNEKIMQKNFYMTDFQGKVSHKINR